MVMLMKSILVSPSLRWGGGVHTCGHVYVERPGVSHLEAGGEDVPVVMLM